MIKGKSQPLSWILKIPIYHHPPLNCKINVGCNMLSMQLSPGSMTATWLGRPETEIHPHGLTRGAAVRRTPSRSRARGILSVLTQTRWSSGHFMAASITGSSFVLANEILLGETVLLHGFRSSTPALDKAVNEGVCLFIFALRYVCWERCVCTHVHVCNCVYEWTHTFCGCLTFRGFHLVCSRLLLVTCNHSVSLRCPHCGPEATFYHFH